MKNRETVYAVEFNFRSGHGIRTGLVKTKGHVTAKMVSARDWEISYTVSENKKKGRYVPLVVTPILGRGQT